MSVVLEVGPPKSGYPYSSIMDALAAAQAGDTIKVYKNIGASMDAYDEHVLIDKENITIEGDDSDLPDSAPIIGPSTAARATTKQNDICHSWR